MKTNSLATSFTLNQNAGYAISADGESLRFSPTFEKGDRETQAFAHEAKDDIEKGGVSIAFGRTVTPEAIKQAISLLLAMI